MGVCERFRSLNGKLCQGNEVLCRQCEAKYIKRPQEEPQHRVTRAASRSDAEHAATGTVADLASPPAPPAPAEPSSRHEEATASPEQNASQTRQHQEDMAAQPDHVPEQTKHCIEQCHLDRSGTGDMIRCCLCFRWYHEMCVSEVDKETPWWVCPTCRSLAPSVAALSALMTQLQDNMSKVLDMNARLVESVNDLSCKNELLAAQVASLTTALSSRTQVTPNTQPTKNVPNLLIGASTIRDIACTDPKGLYIISRGGAKTGDILKILKDTNADSYGDVIIHVVTNDCATKYPVDKICDNFKWPFRPSVCLRLGMWLSAV